MKTTPVAAILILAVCVGCQEKRSADTGHRQQNSDAASAAQNQAEEVRQALSKRLDQLDGEVEKLEKKAEKASATARGGLEEQAKELRADARKLRARMSKWDDKAESSWRGVKKETEDGLDKAEQSIKKALNDIRN